jgi:hypothetical protein
MPPLSKRHIESLANELIKNRCGSHSLGLVYDFLLKAGYDANEAEAEFIRFLSGQLHKRLLQRLACG